MAATLRAELPGNAGRLEVAALDLADLDSVRAFMPGLPRFGAHAGRAHQQRGRDGAPAHPHRAGHRVAAGHQPPGPLRAHDGLLPALGPKGRVVTVASGVHTRGKAKNVLETLTVDRAFTTRRYSPYGAYDDSKLANVLFTRGLAKRLAPGQSAHSIHPGVIGTNLARSMGVIGKVIVFFLKLFAKTPAQGAATSVFAATAPELAGQIGRLSGQLRGRDLLTRRAGRRARRAAVDRQRAARRRRLTRTRPQSPRPSHGASGTCVTTVVDIEAPAFHPRDRLSASRAGVRRRCFGASGLLIMMTSNSGVMAERRIRPRAPARARRDLT